MDQKMCGTYEANLGFFVIAFGIPGISVLILSFPHITLKDIMASSILLGTMLLGILYIHYKS